MVCHLSDSIYHNDHDEHDVKPNTQDTHEQTFESSARLETRMTYPLLVFDVFVVLVVVVLAKSQEQISCASW